MMLRPKGMYTRRTFLYNNGRLVSIEIKLCQSLLNILHSRIFDSDRIKFFKTAEIIKTGFFYESAKTYKNSHFLMSNVLSRKLRLAAEEDEQSEAM